MIIDTSALVAIALEEPGHDELLATLVAADTRGIGCPTMPFGPRHWEEAAIAFLRIGRGRHPAGLNFGDCLTYAVARLADRPLLCVGNDFRQTDLRMA